MPRGVWQGKKPRKSSGRMASKGFPNPIDVHVGHRIRQRRTLLGMSQERLGEAIEDMLSGRNAKGVIVFDESAD